MKPTEYQESLAYLYGLQKMGIKLGLANINNLLEALDNPQRQFHSIHVAGSNGKGSTCAYLANILQEAGYKVGLYTSPHLIDFTERIKINEQPVPRKQVVRLSNKLKTIVKNNPLFNPETNYPTFFEMVTALAFQFFSDEKVDIAVLETGMGGRLDATNTVAPLLSIITNICLEHQVYLGNTITDIAVEKAGIIKNNTPLLTAIEQPEALKVMEEKCRKQNASLHHIKNEARYTVKQRWPWQTFTIESPSGTLEDLSIYLLGDFQLQNAILAIRAAQLLSQTGWSVKKEAIRTGLAKTRWPGRMQVMSTRPYLLLDGAHNPTAVKEMLSNLNLFPYKTFIVVLGIMEDKDIAEIVPLFDLADILILTCANISRAASPQELASKIKQHRGQILISESVPKAIRQAKSIATEEDLICVTGSLYVVGEAQAELNGNPLETVRSIQ